MKVQRKVNIYINIKLFYIEYTLHCFSPQQIYFVYYIQFSFCHTLFFTINFLCLKKTISKVIFYSIRIIIRYIIYVNLVSMNMIKIILITVDACTKNVKYFFVELYPYVTFLCILLAITLNA